MLVGAGSALWYSTRASAIVLWILCAASVGWGLAVSGKAVRRRGLPAWMLSLHRHLASLTLVFVVVHLGTLAADTSVEFGAREFLVPMASTWRPGAVTWGVVATYLLVIVLVSSWGMRRLPRRLWHGLHALSLPMVVAGSVHAALAGTDVTEPIVQWLALVSTIGITGFATFRVLTPRRDPAALGRLGDARAAARGERAARSPAGWAPPAVGTARSLGPRPG